MTATTSKRRVGQNRKPANKIKKPFVFSIYLDDEQMEFFGGRDTVFEMVNEMKTKWRMELLDRFYTAKSNGNV